MDGRPVYSHTYNLCTIGIHNSFRKLFIGIFHLYAPWDIGFRLRNILRRSNLFHWRLFPSVTYLAWNCSRQTKASKQIYGALFLWSASHLQCKGYSPVTIVIHVTKYEQWGNNLRIPIQTEREPVSFCHTMNVFVGSNKSEYLTRTQIIVQIMRSQREYRRTERVITSDSFPMKNIPCNIYFHSWIYGQSNSGIQSNPTNFFRMCDCRQTFKLSTFNRNYEPQPSVYFTWPSETERRLGFYQILWLTTIITVLIDILLNSFC